MTLDVPSQHDVLNDQAKKTLDHTFCILFHYFHFRQKIPCIVCHILCDKMDHFTPKTAKALSQAAQAQAPVVSQAAQAQARLRSTYLQSYFASHLRFSFLVFSSIFS